MAQIFAKQADITQHPNRNNFPLSHNVYGTYKAGIIYPNFCRIIPPTSSIRLKTEVFMNFMPTAYPLQSRMRLIQHYHAVPLRLLWKDFENWAMRLAPDAVPPYIDLPAEKYFTGSIFDYLDAPTTVVSDDGIDVSLKLHGTSSAANIEAGNPTGVDRFYFARPGMVQNNSTAYTLYERSGRFFEDDPLNLFSRLLVAHNMVDDPVIYKQGNGWADVPDMPSRGAIVGYAVDCSGMVCAPSGDRLTFAPAAHGSFTPDYRTATGNLKVALFTHERRGESIYNCYLRFIGGSGTMHSVNLSRIENWYVSDEKELESFLEVQEEYKSGTVYIVFLQELGASVATMVQKPSLFWACSIDASEPLEMSDVIGANPYYSSTNNGTDTRRMSALPCRAYEMVYNYFYRNKTGNQPFIVDGKTKYNEWLTTDEGGADTTDYHLFCRNWELDAFTSCLPSPQMGDAPLVGITNIDALGNIQYSNEDGSVTTIGRMTDDGNITVTDTNLDQQQSRSLVNLSTSGISIADFRQTNALQTFLEQTLRSGLTYYDFIRGHFSKGPKKAELQMPEFLGGTSVPVTVNMVTNTSTANNVPLGSYAGQALAAGSARHDVNYYADDFTVIIGVMCLVPDPAYSQIIAPHWKLDNPLDLYYPEFGQLGMQPITYGDMMPIQSKVASMRDNSKKLSDVFGYQRPNWEMIYQPDTLHGEFRRALNRYVVNRRFGNRPELGTEFLEIDPAEVSRSFVVTTAEAGSGDDIAVGQIRHTVTCKEPVHKVVIPSLGR